MNDIVLHEKLAHAPWMDPALWRLPGIKPVQTWLTRDEAFAGQMALRDRLISGHQAKVHALLPTAEDAAGECLDLALTALSQDSAYRIDAKTVTRPDGTGVHIDRHAPLLTLGRLVQEDICLMQPGPDGAVLVGAILCFPASWTLAEKIGRPLMGIHAPVQEYDGTLGKRVQRLFDTIRPDQLLMRANAILYHEPTLFNPRSEADPPALRHQAPGGQFMRSERQVLRRLPGTGVVVFSIHTTMIPVDRLTPPQRRTMAAAFGSDA